MDGTFSKKRKGETTGKKLQKIKVWKPRECAREYRSIQQQRDIRKVTVVKSEDGQILAEKEVVLRRWREYFEHLLNVENEWEELTQLPVVEGPIQQVSLKEVSMKRKNNNWNGENIPEDWRTIILVPVYKQKGDVLECGNHRGIKLLERLLKGEEKILDQKIREVVDIGNMQFGFRLRRGTTDAKFGAFRKKEESLLQRTE
ncbi:uncharacterized protein LOC134771892 [Penaeus indicus]|uniref:uncharacterized protein LOC134771892 n=1 Tax=Penaeus indicus TaxID=29960 RepID=UPI00300DAEAA